LLFVTTPQGQITQGIVEGASECDWEGKNVQRRGFCKSFYRRGLLTQHGKRAEKRRRISLALEVGVI